MAKKTKKVRKNVVRGIIHVKATNNNTMITITDTNGETLAWDSAGTIGFKGARKATPFAATRAGESVGQKVRKMGMSEAEVRIRGTGGGHRGSHPRPPQRMPPAQEAPRVVRLQQLSGPAP
jgi:small subunit ribosomal protein S11